MKLCAKVLYIAPVCHVQFYNDVKTQFSPQALSAHHPIPHVHIQSSISCSFSHSEPAPSCLHAYLRACSTSLWTTSTSCTSRSSATKRSSSSPLNFFATSTTILIRFNHDNSSIKIQMNQSSGKPSIHLSPALVQGAKPFQRDVHEAS